MVDPGENWCGLVPRGSLKTDIEELQTFEMKRDFVTVIDLNLCARRVYFQKLHNGIYYGYLDECDGRCVHFDVRCVHIIVRGCRMKTDLFADGYAALCRSIINDLKLRQKMSAHCNASS